MLDDGDGSCKTAIGWWVSRTCILLTGAINIIKFRVNNKQKTNNNKKIKYTQSKKMKASRLLDSIGCRSSKSDKSFTGWQNKHAETRKSQMNRRSKIRILSNSSRFILLPFQDNSIRNRETTNSRCSSKDNDKCNRNRDNLSNNKSKGSKGISNRHNSRELKQII